MRILCFILLTIMAVSPRTANGAASDGYSQSVPIVLSPKAGVTPKNGMTGSLIGTFWLSSTGAYVEENLTLFPRVFGASSNVPLSITMKASANSVQTPNGKGWASLWIGLPGGRTVTRDTNAPSTSKVAVWDSTIDGAIVDTVDVGNLVVAVGPATLQVIGRVTSTIHDGSLAVSWGTGTVSLSGSARITVEVKFSVTSLTKGWTGRINQKLTTFRLADGCEFSPSITVNTKGRRGEVVLDCPASIQFLRLVADANQSDEKFTLDAVDRRIRAQRFSILDH